jgi:hypothetical protein
MLGAMEKTYSSSEIQRIAKITKMQAIHWTQTGIITPLEDAHGRGSRRVYSWENLIEMMICRELNRFGAERSVMDMIIGGMIRQPLGTYRNYWDFVKNNPKTKMYFLMIVRVNYWQLVEYLNDKFVKRKAPRFAEKGLESIEELYNSLDGKEKEKALPIKNVAPEKCIDIKYLAEHKELEAIVAKLPSTVIVNIGALITEANKAEIA